MESRSKIVKKHFGFDQYEKEAEFLTTMHSQGWKFVRVEFGFLKSSYHFEQCKPENISYQLDYILDNLGNSISSDELEEKLLLYEDAGWEKVVGDENTNGWYYFRRKYVEKDSRLYTDLESKLQLAEKVWAKVTLWSSISLILILLLFPHLLDTVIKEKMNSFVGIAGTAVLILYLIALLFMVYMIGRVLVFKYRIQNNTVNRLSMEATEKNKTRLNGKNKKQNFIIFILLLALITSISVFAILNHAIMQFCVAAAPWVVMGCVIAAFAALQGKK
ncbi:DUF2812 domain-containing protein [Sedimentibacter sp. zth1]|uniref:DUF2812 domain-containing protein n=1 Tax=Sedimentibacter sp. zth1 TaxID=2816908 RepID=UPI001A92B3BD|nr:DUF2812 domain-containing protein [Sedimentibacter sp. zth1]QSX05685.1 DUF2812 domain-containing protein [Sedimentibacter sp. zth1]